MNFVRLPSRILGVEMFVTLPRLMLMACLLSPALSWGLGLGEIHLNSSLNEPMNAEIDLIAAGPEELSALRATLAAKDAFTRYGIDRPPFLSTLTFRVGKSKDGRDVLLVRSTDSIPEPFVTFLVEVNWARGRLMREYTVLLDPPVYTPGERASSAGPPGADCAGLCTDASRQDNTPRREPGAHRHHGSAWRDHACRDAQAFRPLWQIREPRSECGQRREHCSREPAAREFNAKQRGEHRAGG